MTTFRICSNCNAPCSNFRVEYCICGHKFPTVEEIREDSRQHVYDCVLVLGEAPGIVVAEMYDRFVKTFFGEAELEHLNRQKDW